MHDPPPSEAGFHGVLREVKGRKEKQRQTPQTAHQYQVNRSLAPLDQGHGHIEQQGKRHQNDTDLGGQRLLQVAAAHGGQSRIAGDRRQMGIRHEKISEDCQRCGGEKYPESDQREPGAVEFGLRLFRDDKVSGAHEGHQ
jgi:hypothetical protein